MNDTSFTPFPKITEIFSTTSTVQDGSIKNELGFNDKAINSFAKRHAIIPSQMVFMKQVHSGDIAVVLNSTKKEISNVDGLITNKKNVFLAVLTADCLPIVFYDPEKQVIAAVHAGYKGLLQGIIQNVIKKMRTEFAVNSKNLYVGIGPAIGRCCYMVDSSRTKQFGALLPKNPEIIEKRQDELFLDLGRVAEVLLASEKVQTERITKAHICTKDAKNVYFSYRRENNQQRMVTVIGLI